MFRVRHDYSLLRPGVPKSRIHQRDSGVNEPAPCTWHSKRENVDQVCRVRERFACRRLRESARAAVKGGRSGQTDVSPHQHKYAEADETDRVFGEYLAGPGCGRESARESVKRTSHRWRSARCIRERAAAARVATA